MWDLELLEEKKPLGEIKPMEILIFSWKELYFSFHMTLTEEKWDRVVMQGP